MKPTHSHGFSLACFGLLSLGWAGGCGGPAVATPTDQRVAPSATVSEIDEASAYAQTVRCKLGDDGALIVKSLSFVVSTDERGRRTCVISGPVDAAHRTRIADGLNAVHPTLTVLWK